MKAIPQQHSFRFHNLGIGDIQLGKKPEHITGMLPFSSYAGKDHFRVYPNAAHYHAFNGAARGTIERDDPGILLRHLLAGINEAGFINRIFLYPQEANEQLAWRLSQLYGEPLIGKAQAGIQNAWITDSETEVTLCHPPSNQTGETVIAFRFFHDLSALKEYIIQGRT
jgi:hypothetical protein